MGEQLTRLVARAALLLALVLGCATAGALPAWELAGTTNRIVVLGSVHFLREQDYRLPASVQDAFRQADVVAMELDMDALSPQETAVTVARLAMDEQGRTLPELLGPAAYADARERAAALAIDLAAFQDFEPWYVALAVTQLRLAQLGFDPALGIEARLSADAQRAGKELAGLESLEAQLGTLDSLPASAQRRFLQTTLDEAATVADEIDDIITAWRRADTNALERKLLDSIADQPDVYRQIIVERNRRFASAIAAMAGDSRDYLVVIGALHLVGPDSVIRLLRERGVRMRPLAADGR